MINLTITNQIELIAFWLCFTRFIGIFMQLPLLDGQFVPVIVKILVTLVLTYAFYPFVSVAVKQDIALWGVKNALGLTLYHLVAGLLIGLLVKSIMAIFISAGNIMTQSMGFASVNYFDPSFSTRVGPMEKLLQFTMLVLILSSGALLPMFKGAIQSFMTMNLTSFPSASQSSQFFLHFFKQIFISGLVLASPLVFTNFLMNFLMGVIARLVPQMNVLMLSFIVNIGAGLLVFSVISNELWQVGMKAYVKHLGEWFQWVS